jgi:riboflavin kinase/FMN adenylyltransferase
MILIRSLNQISKTINQCCLTVGNFDGLHQGHLEIINKVKDIAKEKKLSSALLTFQPHPLSFIKKNYQQDFIITNLATKIDIIKKLGIDYLIILKFDKNFADISAKDFIDEILIKKLNTKHLVIGYNFNFGKNREGNIETLKKTTINLNQVDPVMVKLDNQEITSSSTNIRNLIKEGNFDFVNKILTKNFTISGTVNYGQKLATKIGFPTLNIMPKPFMIKPKFGVYKTKTFIPSLKKVFPSITNFGIKPTINYGGQPIYETHIPNFSENIYEQKIYIEFINFIREEKIFSNVEDLKKQISKDIFECNL